ncbi:large ATP-binding protein [Streptomyces griseus]|uniref:large ATP-binding protein n=1 Tax=Streptomyces griseus TaxID=1911 RepID=UPI0033DBE87C
MNPYDPNTEPGTHFVADALGVSNVSMLNTTYHPDDPLYRAATRAIGAAYDLDELHTCVTHAAQDAHWLLEPTARGELTRNLYAQLRTAIPKLGELLARRNRSYDQLVECLSEYQRLLADPDAARPSTAHELGRGQRSGRDDDWAIEGDRQLRALEVVELGGLRLHQTSIGENAYVADEMGRRPQPLAATVRRMVTDGLLHQDTSTNPYRAGQLLSLTPGGKAALRAARMTATRVSAAVRRSGAPANLGRPAHPAAAPSAGISSTASHPRSR